MSRKQVFIHHLRGPQHVSAIAKKPQVRPQERCIVDLFVSLLMALPETIELIGFFDKNNNPYIEGVFCFQYSILF